MFHLAHFELRDMLRCGRELRSAAGDAATLEEAARAVVRYLYDGSGTAAGGERSCALVRFYATHPYDGLDPQLQEFARGLLGGKAPADEKMRCLTLLASAGDEPPWNSRSESRGHQAIPLPSPEIVEKAPMIAQLIKQFGLDVTDVIKPAADVSRRQSGKRYGVFHVEDARQSPYIPAQDDFVTPYGIRSVLGFGGTLRTGDLFAVIMFSRVHIPRGSAERFQTIALDLKAALFRFEEDEVFATSRIVSGLTAGHGIGQY